MGTRLGDERNLPTSVWISLPKFTPKLNASSFDVTYPERLSMSHSHRAAFTFFGFRSGQRTAQNGKSLAGPIEGPHFGSTHLLLPSGKHP